MKLRSVTLFFVATEVLCAFIVLLCIWLTGFFCSLCSSSNINSIYFGDFEAVSVNKPRRRTIENLVIVPEDSPPDTRHSNTINMADAIANADSTVSAYDESDTNPLNVSSMSGDDDRLDDDPQAPPHSGFYYLDTNTGKIEDMTFQPVSTPPIWVPHTYSRNFTVPTYEEATYLANSLSRL